VIAGAALASIRHLRANGALRDSLAERANALKAALDSAGLPRLASDSHIIPLHIGDAALCRAAAQVLLYQHDIYATPINYPTVPRGQERLRLCATPLHTNQMIADLVVALQVVLRPMLRNAA
jgi:5-aminolevulinate synthase